MLRFSLIFFLYLLVPTIHFAQDAYHLQLEQYLSDNYNLSGGEWVFYDNEIQNQDASYWYGDMATSYNEVLNENFSQVTNITVNQYGDYFYDSGWGAGSLQAIAQGDICLLVINLKKTSEKGKVSLFIQNSDNNVFERAITLQLQDEWMQYLVPFQASIDYSVDELITGLNMAWEEQTVQIAGMNIMNFGNNYTLDQMPFEVHNDLYGGHEEDAPWRDEAEERIEAHRKSDLEVTVVDAENNPLADATVTIEMLEHDFKWGTHITLDKIAGNVNQDDTYQSRLLDIDGEGHRLNWVVPGNSFKWPGWEENWMTTPAEKVNAVNWLKDEGFKIRYHTLVWPSWYNSPIDLEANADDPAYIINRTNNWINDITSYPGLVDMFDEFDIINESTTERDYEYALAGYNGYVTGREYYIDLINQLDGIYPNTPQVINDYITLSRQQTQGAEYDFLKNTLHEVVDGGADLNGIGFQGHIGTFPTSIYEVEQVLNDFADEFDMPLKITEYDMTSDGVTDELAGEYFDDFLTMTFSIPEVDMFMLWGLWDGSHWQGNGVYFYENWDLKPAGEVAIQRLFNDWWTNESDFTDENGAVIYRPFKGSHQITIEFEDQVLVDTLFIDQDSEITYLLEGVNGIGEEFLEKNTLLYPNPAQNQVTVQSVQIIDNIAIYDAVGKVVLQENNINRAQFLVNIQHLPNGHYSMELNGDKSQFYQSFEVRR